jgi:prophage regulatory protein
MDSQESSALLSLPEVERLTGLRKSAIYLRVARGDFPAPLVISSRCSRWHAHEIQAWVEALPRKGAAQEAATAA